jgi:hypothetical protein
VTITQVVRIITIKHTKTDIDVADAILWSFIEVHVGVSVSKLGVPIVQSDKD